jgi:hypothetical protein
MNSGLVKFEELEVPIGSSTRETALISYCQLSNPIQSSQIGMGIRAIDATHENPGLESLK